MNRVISTKGIVMTKGEQLCLEQFITQSREFARPGCGLLIYNKTWLPKTATFGQVLTDLYREEAALQR